MSLACQDENSSLQHEDLQNLYGFVLNNALGSRNDDGHSHGWSEWCIKGQAIIRELILDDSNIPPICGGIEISDAERTPWKRAIRNRECCYCSSR